LLLLLLQLPCQLPLPFCQLLLLLLLLLKSLLLLHHLLFLLHKLLLLLLYDGLGRQKLLLLYVKV